MTTERMLALSAPMVRAFRQRRKVLAFKRVRGDIPADATLHMVTAMKAAVVAPYPPPTRGNRLTYVSCPYAHVKRVWIAEPWAPMAPHGVEYRAGEPFVLPNDAVRQWRPERVPSAPLLVEAWNDARALPRAAARYGAHVLEVGVRRLHDVTDDDARAAGMPETLAQALAFGFFGGVTPPELNLYDTSTPRELYLRHWELRNGVATAHANPYVWRLHLWFVNLPPTDRF